MRVLVNYVDYTSNDEFGDLVMEITEACYVKEEGSSKGCLEIRELDEDYVYLIDNMDIMTCSMICENLLKDGFVDLRLYGKCYIPDCNQEDCDNDV